MLKGIWEDAKSIAKRDPAAKSTLEVFLLYPGFHAIIFHRIAHWFYKKRLFFLARLISQFSRFITGVEIHPGAKIGKGLFLDHGMGVVVGETAEVGDYCTIYHGVTLGGTGKDKGKRHPTVGNNVLIGAGAQLLGPIKIGDGAMIGAGSVVLDEVEAGTTVTGPKARKVVSRSKRMMAPSFELDQIHYADPVAQELCRLQVRIERLEAALKGEGAMKENTEESVKQEINKCRERMTNNGDDKVGG